MSRTPAARLAKLKVEHQEWKIVPAPAGLPGFIAENEARSRSLYARDLDDLENQLTEQDHPRKET